MKLNASWFNLKTFFLLKRRLNPPQFFATHNEDEKGKTDSSPTMSADVKGERLTKRKHDPLAFRLKQDLREKWVLLCHPRKTKKNKQQKGVNGFPLLSVKATNFVLYFLGSRRDRRKVEGV